MNTKELAKIAMIAAVYTVVSLVLAPFSYGNIQVRIAEALTMLPLIYKPSIKAITLGCFLTNLIGALSGVNPTGLLDAVVGTLATLLAGICTYRLRDKTIHNIPALAICMPVLFNAVIVGIELGVLYFPSNVVIGSIVCGLEVGAGELIAVVIGWLLLPVLKRTNLF